MQSFIWDSSFVRSHSYICKDRHCYATTFCSALEWERERGKTSSCTFFSTFQMNGWNEKNIAFACAHTAESSDLARMGADRARMAFSKTTTKKYFVFHLYCVCVLLLTLLNFFCCSFAHAKDSYVHNSLIEWCYKHGAHTITKRISCWMKPILLLLKLIYAQLHKCVCAFDAQSQTHRWRKREWSTSYSLMLFSTLYVHFVLCTQCNCIKQKNKLEPVNIKIRRSAAMFNELTKSFLYVQRCPLIDHSYACVSNACFVSNHTHSLIAHNLI